MQLKNFPFLVLHTYNALVAFVTMRYIKHDWHWQWHCGTPDLAFIAADKQWFFCARR